MASDVAFKTPVRLSPVGEGRFLLVPLVVFGGGVGGESSLSDEGSHESVGIVVEEESVVGLHHGLHGSVQESDFFEIEVLGVELALC